MMEGGRCSFVFDDAWRETHDLRLKLEDDVANAQGNWHCPRQTTDDEDHCIFYQDDDTSERQALSDDEFAQVFIDAVYGKSDQRGLVDADRMPAMEQARRRKEFLGATLGDLHLPYQTLNTDDRSPIDLRGAHAGDVDCRHMEIDHKLRLSGLQATRIDLSNARIAFPLKCDDVRVEGGVSLLGATVKGVVSLGWDLIGGATVDGRVWLTAFVHYYNTHRPNQALENRTPAEGVMNR